MPRSEPNWPALHFRTETSAACVQGRYTAQSLRSHAPCEAIDPSQQATVQAAGGSIRVQGVSTKSTSLTGAHYVSLLGDRLQLFTDFMSPTVIGCSSMIMHRAVRPKTFRMVQDSDHSRPLAMSTLASVQHTGVGVPNPPPEFQPAKAGHSFSELQILRPAAWSCSVPTYRRVGFTGGPQGDQREPVSDTSAVPPPGDAQLTRLDPLTEPYRSLQVVERRGPAAVDRIRSANGRDDLSGRGRAAADLRPSTSTSNRWDWIGHVLDEVLDVATPMFSHHRAGQVVLIWRTPSLEFYRFCQQDGEPSPLWMAWQAEESSRPRPGVCPHPACSRSSTCPDTEANFTNHSTLTLTLITSELYNDRNFIRDHQIRRKHRLIVSSGSFSDIPNHRLYNYSSSQRPAELITLSPPGLITSILTATTIQYDRTAPTLNVSSVDHICLSLCLKDSGTTDSTVTPTSATDTTSARTADSSPATTLYTTDLRTTEQTNLTTSATDHASTVGTPMACSFSQSCGDQSVYYWMMISVEVTGNVSDESNISAWLQSLFQEHLGECSSTLSATSPTPLQIPLMVSTQPSGPSLSTHSLDLTNTTGNFSTAPSVQNVNSPLLQTSTSGNSSVNDTESTASVVQKVEVTCDNRTAIRSTECTVLLQLSQPTSPCCIARIVNMVRTNSTFQGQVLGNQVERVAKGLCQSSETAPPAGSFEKCNGSISVEVPCNSSAKVNISCSGNSQNVYATLGTQDQMNCSTDYEKPTNYCYCSAYCNSTAAYYNLNFGITDPSLDTEQLTSLVGLYSVSLTCTLPVRYIRMPRHSRFSLGQVLLRAGSPKGSCNVIVKLKHAMEVCNVSSALKTALQHQHGIDTNGLVTRVAICSWENVPNLDQLQPAMHVSVNLSSFEFCKVPDLGSFLNYCNKGTDISVLLNESCPDDLLTTSQPSTVFTPITNATSTVISTNNTTTSTNTTAITTNTTSLQNTTATPTTTAMSSNATVTAATANTTVPTTSPTSAEAKAEELLNLSKNASGLNSTQVEQLVDSLEALLSGPNVSLALANTSINIVSNLLDAPARSLASSSNRIIGIVDKVGLKLVVQGQSETVLSTSVALAVNKVDGTHFQQTSITLTDPSSLQINGGTRSKRSAGATVQPPQGSVTFPASLTSGLSVQQQQQASRVQFNFYQRNSLFQDRALNPNQTRLISGILGSSVANLSISSLRDDVIITLRNTEPVSANVSVSCVFWDFGLNGGSGGWSSRGCKVLNSTVNETVCGCNHLTSFGVLLDISRQGITSRLQATILTYITYIGCGISAIFLSITLLTYLSFEKLRKDIPSKILIQLCLALLLLNLVYLLDSWLALYPDAVGLCISTAFFLHYFLLASFTWMALEAVHMYFALVKVFNTYISRFMLKLGVAGWGIPLLVVIIVIAIDKNNYGLVSYGNCWLKNDIAFYVAVVAYFCVVFLLNLTMFIVVMVQICRIKRQNPHNVQHRNGLQDVRSVAGLTVLLGLTWGFAFFAWGPVNLAFMYLFAIFNTLQGFFIFVFHCAVKENVRRQWRIYLCCGKFRLPENSDWSHTATQKTKKSSLNRVGTSSVKSSNSNNSSSSTTFLVSNGSASGSGSGRSLGISSPFDDEAITAPETSTDVVLNEINDRYRGQRSF
ncbi:hypothetical protein NFI96_033304 [Prochilodus magdalenae]|nr:hypothetical protein NFI96_033304 [Prochilodus magdalenae]